MQRTTDKGESNKHSRSGTQKRLQSVESVETLYLGEDDPDKSRWREALLNEVFNLRTPSGELALDQTARETLRSYLKQIEYEEEVEVSDYNEQIQNDVDILRDEVAAVVRQVEQVQETMERRWQDYKETTSERLKGAERAMDRATDTVQTLVKTQEDRLGRLENKFDEQRRELEGKIDSSRNWTIGVLTIVIALATYIGSL